MSLPPEIRNRIYGYVLGGNKLHVNVVNHGYHGGAVRMKLEITICTAVIDEESAATMIRDGEEDTEITDWNGRHHSCRISQVPYNVALLRTCSQIHSEAALLPFQTNRFMFDDPEALQFFLRKTMYIQRKSIVAVSLETGDFREDGGMLLFSALRGLKKMTGLKRVVLFEQFPLEGSMDLTDLEKKVIREDLFEWLSLFKFATLEWAMVCFYRGSIPSLPVPLRRSHLYHLIATVAASAPSRLTYFNEVCEEVESILLQKGNVEQGNGSSTKI